MISVYNVSNLKIVYNFDTDSFIAFDNKGKDIQEHNEPGTEHFQLTLHQKTLSLCR